MLSSNKWSKLFSKFSVKKEDFSRWKEWLSDEEVRKGNASLLVYEIASKIKLPRPYKTSPFMIMTHEWDDGETYYPEYELKAIDVLKSILWLLEERVILEKWELNYLRIALEDYVNESDSSLESGSNLRKEFILLVNDFIDNMDNMERFTELGERVSDYVTKGTERVNVWLLIRDVWDNVKDTLEVQ